MMTPPRSLLSLLLIVVGQVVIPACAEPGCDNPLWVCDIGSTDCREHVFVQTACARGFEGRTPPPVDSITREEYVERLRSDAPATAEESLRDSQRARSMRMLRLAPLDTTSSSDAIEALASAVLAFYDPLADAVTLIETNLDDAERSTGVFVLSHEFVHAQADIDVDLAVFLDAHATSLDSSITARAVGEGDAMHYSNLTMARQDQVGEPTLTKFLEYYAEIKGGAIQDAVDPNVDYQALALAFPYPYGGQLVTEAWFSGGDPAVLGLYDDPWPSTADVLRLARNVPPRGTPDLPDITEPALPAGWSPLADDTLGAWLMFAFAARHELDVAQSQALADDWSGDRILVVAGAVTQEVALVWRVRFGTEGSAQAFAMVGGVPPAEGAWSVTQAGTEVTIVAAPDSESLPEWESTLASAFVERSLPLRSGSAARVAPPIRVPKWLPR